MVQALCRYVLKVMRETALLELVQKTTGHLRSLHWGNYRGWIGMEHGVIRRHEHELDAHAVVTAHALKLDDLFTYRVLRLCACSIPGANWSTLASQIYIHLVDALTDSLSSDTHDAPADAARFSEAARSLDLVRREGDLLMAASSTLGVEQFQNIGLSLVRSIGAGREDAAQAVFATLRDLILNSPSDHDVAVALRSAPIGRRLCWERVVGEGSIATWTVLDALSLFIRDRQRDEHVRFEAYASLIRVFGISYLQYPSHEAFIREANTHAAQLQQTFDDCRRDLKQSFWPLDLVMSPAADKTRSLLRALGSRNDCENITGPLDDAFREAIDGTLLPTTRYLLAMITISELTPFPVVSPLTAAVLRLILSLWIGYIRRRHAKKSSNIR
ncbi:hypothetical protein NUW54_g13019 [Trametes sanguinea]|uniref:Uncharacterized protein n=1 Tax=Trametes sanguinea TaxID=158606 RepID=A0ACC1MQA9_9APHY|nr:hypothetical protein NUW54_g13019 [Trametes sanguinea]